MSTLSAVITALFPRRVVYRLLLKLSEYAARQTDNTLDDEMVKIIKGNFRDNQIIK